MLKKALFTTVMIILGGCGMLSFSTPSRFPQLSEHIIIGPGTYLIPQWSSDSRYLAFVDESQDPILKVYDTKTETSWNVATSGSSGT